MKNFFLIGLLTIMTISCEKDSNEPNPEIINGIWVETVHKSDTLVFDNESNYFTLNRGPVMTATGIYGYEIEQDSISLRWALSSYSGSYKYYFDFEEDKIRIGNFYMSSSENKNEILTFVKTN